MDVREKLVELLKTNACSYPFMCDPTCRYYGFGDCFPDRFADYLIAHGVTMQKHGYWISLTDCANAGVYCSVCHKKVYKEDYAWCKNNLNGYILYCNGVSVFLSQVYMTDKEAEKLYHEGENNYYIKKYSEGHTWKSAPHKGEIYKGQEKFRGLDMKKFWR